MSLLIYVNEKRDNAMTLSNQSLISHLKPLFETFLGSDIYLVGRKWDGDYSQSITLESPANTSNAGHWQFYFQWDLYKSI